MLTWNKSVLLLVSGLQLQGWTHAWPVRIFHFLDNNDWFVIGDVAQGQRDNSGTLTGTIEKERVTVWLNMGSAAGTGALNHYG